MIAVSGANGYVGGRIFSHLCANGIDAIALVRKPAPGDRSARRYRLGQPLDHGLLDGISTVIHAAYDTSQRGEDIGVVNVSGSLPLLDGLAARGGHMVMISSLSAFSGAPSLYGRAKLELERLVLERDGVVLRPGLVFGASAGGMFGAMTRALSKSTFAPMVGSGQQRLFVTHDECLAALALEVAIGQSSPGGPVFAACEAPTTLRAIATQILQARGRQLAAIPLPPLLLSFSLNSAEKIGLALPFRSDSLRSLLNPIPLDQVSCLERTSVEFPPLSPELW
jgi:nucleoside-diphosphate-sugar epimerase